MTIGFSIVICCYNSISRIGKTLSYIKNLALPDNVSLELIVVDNASTDATNEFVSEYCKLNINFRHLLVTESKRGLIYARLKGIALARYNYILFCDDDNWLDENYILNAFKTLSNDPAIAVLGGQSIPNFEKSPPPYWFGFINKAYATGQQYEKSSYVDFIWGAGFIVNKDYLTIINDKGFVPLLTGRLGNSLASGEDDELCLAFKCFGFNVYYDDQLILTHYITKNRLTLSYLLKLIRGTAKSAFVLEPYKYSIENKKTASFIHKYYWLNKGIKMLPGLFKETIKLMPVRCWYRRHNQLGFMYLFSYYKRIILCIQYLISFKTFYRNYLLVSEYSNF
jgi:glycosyltransferase involved in cell wall biosynthesis